MTRIDKKFAQLKAESKKAFVSYIMAGDPNLELSYELMERLPASGVDIIELGLPFTCLLYTSPSPRDKRQSRMPSSA